MTTFRRSTLRRSHLSNPVRPWLSADEREDAAVDLALSGRTDLSADGLARRRFLQYSLAGAAMASAGVGFSLTRADAGRAGNAQRVLVLVELHGGNDGLNTVAPVGSGRYRDLRRGLAITPDEGLSITDGLALHPKLTYLKQRWDAGDVAVVQGVGLKDATLSHFDSRAMWEGGLQGTQPGDRPRTGWIGRYVDGLGDQRTGLEAVGLFGSVPLHLQGRSATAVNLPVGSPPAFGFEQGSSMEAVYRALRQLDGAGNGTGPWGAALAAQAREALDLADRLAPGYRNPVRGSNFSSQMRQAARLINLDLGIQVISVRATGFDTHTRLAWEHGVALGNLDEGIGVLFEELDATVADQVAVMTFSEFGRRPRPNGSQGTDHGAASVSLLIGSQVRGGLYGEYPSLDRLDFRGNLVPTVDPRDIYGTVAEAWLGADGAEIVGGRFEGLGLFGAAPDGSGPVPVRVPDVPPTEVTSPAPQPMARQGYLLLDETGDVYNFGRHARYGAVATGAPATIRRHPTEDGYWVISSTGRVEAFGEAPSLPDLTRHRLAAPVVGAAPTSNGRGMWLAGADGGVFALGRARFRGAAAGLGLNEPITGICSSTSDGYWLTGRDGGVFAFGDAPFLGAARTHRPNAPVVSMAAHPDGKGYWQVSSDGGVFAFGSAGFHGSLGAIRLAAPIVDLAPTASGDGYWLLGADGGVFAFGDAAFLGSASTTGTRFVSLSR